MGWQALPDQVALPPCLLPSLTYSFLGPPRRTSLLRRRWHPREEHSVSGATQGTDLLAPEGSLTGSHAGKLFLSPLDRRGK